MKKQIFKNSSVINRRAENALFDTIAKSAITDNRLNSDAKVLLIALLNNSDSYILNIEVEAKKVGLKEKRKISAIKQLRKYGYLISEKSGISWKHTVNEQPNDVHLLDVSLQDVSLKGVQIRITKEEQKKEEKKIEIVIEDTATDNSTGVKIEPIQSNPIIIEEEETKLKINDMAIIEERLEQVKPIYTELLNLAAKALFEDQLELALKLKSDVHNTCNDFANGIIDSIQFNLFCNNFKVYIQALQKEKDKILQAEEQQEKNEINAELFKSECEKQNLDISNYFVQFKIDQIRRRNDYNIQWIEADVQKTKEKILQQLQQQ